MTSLDSAFLASKIHRIEVGSLVGRRPRSAGCNARLGDHGIEVRNTFARITTDDGLTGFGQCRSSAEQLAILAGKPLATAFGSDLLVANDWLVAEFPLWDLYGQYVQKPVYQLLSERAGREVDRELRPRCYDTSLYIDDLKIEDQAESAALLAHEASEGYARGHRAFKIKVGRGARHMPLDIGTQRDVAVIHAIRDEVGPDAIVMIDANNGYNLNLTKRVLAETRDCNLYWVEEAFHEDAVLYEDLQEWLKSQSIPALIADGEGEVSPRLIEWAEKGIIDVVQYDIIDRGLTGWVRIGERLDSLGVRSAPHGYGSLFGPFACAHLSSAIQHFEFVEWDQTTTEGLDTSGYRIDCGELVVPSSPGFGLELDDDRFQAAVIENGFTIGN